MAHGAADVQVCRHRFPRHQDGCIPGHSPQLHSGRLTVGAGTNPRGTPKPWDREVWRRYGRAGPFVVGPDKSRRFGNEAGCGCPAPVRGRRRRPHDALLWGSNPPFRAIDWPTMLRVVFAPAGRTVVGESQGAPLRPVRSGSTSRGTPGASGDACIRPPDWFRTRR